MWVSGSFGRLDQFSVKLLEVNKIRSGSHSAASAGGPLYQNVTIGSGCLLDKGASVIPPSGPP